MPEIYISSIKSNTDNLSERAVHDTLVSFIDHEAIMGEIALKSFVPKGDTLALTREAGHKGPYDDGLEITAHVGIPEIHADDKLSPNAPKYPVFVDQGTGIFGDTHSPIFPKISEFMKLPPKGDLPIFHKSVKGQEGKEFMAATFAFMLGMLKVNGEAFRAELITKLKADQLT